MSILQRSNTYCKGNDFEQTKKCTEIGDANAIYGLGCCYFGGLHGLPQDRAKALEFWHRAGELGYTPSYYSIGVTYYEGNGVERDEKKVHFYELAAMGGVVEARYNLGMYEACSAGNMDRALKHYDYCRDGMYCIFEDDQKDVHGWTGYKR